MILALSLGVYLMYAIVFVLLFAVLFSSIKVLSTAFKLRGKRLFNWNDINGYLFLVFGVLLLLATYWQFNKWGAQSMTESGSVEGAIYDKLFLTTTAIVMFVFVITHILLFYFSYKYRMREGSKALYYPENDKLEIIWTIIPAIVLASLVTYGFVAWTDMTQNPPSEDEANIVELYAYQFGWKARYPGEDGKLGRFSYKLIGGSNDMGIDSNDPNAQDDLRAIEICIPVNEPVLFKFRAQDVIHSAFMPHFRAQMNVVPGLPTQYYFTPTKTTTEIRQIRNDYNFDYLVFCNKICGVAHYNMKMKIKVVDRPGYEEWLTKQKKYFITEEANAEEVDNNLTALNQ